jgi:hypothetical protein
VTTNRRIAPITPRRPDRSFGYVHSRATSSRCQRGIVSGVTYRNYLAQQPTTHLGARARRADAVRHRPAASAGHATDPKESSCSIRWASACPSPISRSDEKSLRCALLLARLARRETFRTVAALRSAPSTRRDFFFENLALRHLVRIESFPGRGPVAGRCKHDAPGVCLISRSADDSLARLI